MDRTPTWEALGPHDRVLARVKATSAEQARDRIRQLLQNGNPLDGAERERIWAETSKAVRKERRSMKPTQRQEDIHWLMELAERLEGSNDIVIIPGWDDEKRGLRESSIRLAARAIVAQDLGPDEGNKIPVFLLGTLLQYIAELLED